MTRKISYFSANFNGRRVDEPKDNASSRRETFSKSVSDSNTYSESEITRETKEFMTPTIIKQQLIEMKRRPNIRFMRLIKSAKITARQMRNVEDIDNLKKILVKELSFMLSEYTDMLVSNNALQLNTYFRINSVVPEAADEARILSRVMIRCNKVKQSTGYLPPKNQRDLSSAMNSFIQAVIDSILKGVDVLNPIMNAPEE